MKTKTKKAIALFTLSAVLASNLWIANAEKNIWTIEVTGDSAKTTQINWNEQYPVTGITGSVTGIKVKAVIEPQISMKLSAKELNLGVLTVATPSAQSLDLEVGTNAKDGVNVTVTSTKGGMKNKADENVIINNTTNVDGMADSYKFKSEAGTSDSTVTGFSATYLTEAEITDTTAKTIYSTNKPEQFNTVADATFTVTATANAQTPAWEYEDELTFTITGNF